MTPFKIAATLYFVMLDYLIYEYIIAWDLKKMKF